LTNEFSCFILSPAFDKAAPANTAGTTLLSGQMADLLYTSRWHLHFPEWER
jgi:hypothetical protein